MDGAVRVVVVACVAACGPQPARVDTTPTGAIVTKYGETLGRTPMKLPAYVEAELYRPGFLPYRLSQRDYLFHDAFVIALAPLPSPPQAPRVAPPPWTEVAAAITAARASDCEAARAMELKLRAHLDAVHSAFVHEVAVARCMEAK